jgi:hypothetical protein
MWAVFISFIGGQVGVKNKSGMTQDEVNNEKVRE